MYNFALIGGSLSHSYSPMIHSKFGDYKYELCEVEEKDLEDLLMSGKYDGFNVTIPYKEKIMDYCDEISNDSRRIGAVNTIVRDADGRYVGYNTDYFGFRYLLENSDIDVAGRKCLILGSGGGSKTVSVVLQDLGAREIIVVSRKGEVNYRSIKEQEDAEIIVNATPVGMFPSNMVSLINLNDFPNCAGVVDLIYNPYRTQLILDAMEKQIPAVSGLGMLVAQGFRASELFQGKELDADEIPIAIEEVRDATLNRILIGMPGAGKTFLGAKMAEGTGREFVDIDDEIESAEAMSIPQIFKEKGEAYFRKLETEKLRETCKRRGLIIATGGGVVTVKENCKIMRQNGTVIWVKRDLDKLETQGRPISKSVPLYRLYDQRKDAYEGWSDFFIDNNEDL
ncbi:MAG: shikimate kinase [Hornefia sp.]|nr:shikimate kinase [Hornefia sp.]